MFYKGLRSAILHLCKICFYQGFIRFCSTGDWQHRNLINRMLFQWFCFLFVKVALGSFINGRFYKVLGSGFSNVAKSCCINAFLGILAGPWSPTCHPLGSCPFKNPFSFQNHFYSFITHSPAEVHQEIPEISFQNKSFLSKEHSSEYHFFQNPELHQK